VRSAHQKIPSQAIIPNGNHDLVATFIININHGKHRNPGNTSCCCATQATSSLRHPCELNEPNELNELNKPNKPNKPNELNEPNKPNKPNELNEPNELNKP
jgi:hypothetical protein